MQLIFDRLNNYILLKKDSDAWNECLKTEHSSPYLQSDCHIPFHFSEDVYNFPYHIIFLLLVHSR